MICSRESGIKIDLMQDLDKMIEQARSCLLKATKPADITKYAALLASYDAEKNRGQGMQLQLSLSQSACLQQSVFELEGSTMAIESFCFPGMELSDLCMSPGWTISPCIFEGC